MAQVAPALPTSDAQTHHALATVHALACANPRLLGSPSPRAPAPPQVPRAQSLLAPASVTPPSLHIHLTDLSQQAEDQARQFLGLDLDAIHHASL